MSCVEEFFVLKDTYMHACVEPLQRNLNMQGLFGVASGNVDPSRLMTPPIWGAIIPALPTIALAFVFQMIVPVVVIRLGNDPEKVQTVMKFTMITSLLY
jgi:amino acid permease